MPADSAGRWWKEDASVSVSSQHVLNLLIRVRPGHYDSVLSSVGARIKEG